MPNISRNIPDLELEGPTIDLLLLPAKSIVAAMHETSPPVIRVRALIDTGAAASVIKAGLPEKLRIHPTGRVVIHTPSSSVACPMYSVQILFPEHSALVPRPAQVVEAPMQGQDVEFLIGRDLLRDGMLVYQGHCNAFTLSF